MSKTKAPPIANDTTVVRQPAGSTARLDYFPAVEQFIPRLGDQPFGFADLYQASGLTANEFVVAAAFATSISDTPIAAQQVSHEANAIELLTERRLWQAVATVSNALKDVFGDAAYVHIALDNESEIDEPALVLEAHLQFGADDPDHLVALQDRFLTRYVAEVAPEDRSVLRLALFADA